ncbi:MAG: adenosylmethionine decarboxylase [Deltaproteobacteria bacterium]|nr:adenosylmethionine decarboxylase [Deltaproteobacteria bacterium]
MKATGRHLLVEYRDCDRTVLNDLSKIEELMRKAAEAADAIIVGSVFHPFLPQGVSGVVVIEESHLSIHTWPEYGYAAVDFFTCGKCHPDQAHDVLMEGLGAANSEKMLVMRGQLEEPSSMQVTRHESEDSPYNPKRFVSR